MTTTKQTLSKIFAEQMFFLRTKNKWSQDALAAASDIHRNTLGHIERGEACPSLDLASKIANAFGLTLSEMLNTEYGGGK